MGPQRVGHDWGTNTHSQDGWTWRNPPWWLHHQARCYLSRVWSFSVVRRSGNFQKCPGYLGPSLHGVLWRQMEMQWTGDSRVDPCQHLCKGWGWGGLLVDLRDSILMCWRWILGLDFAKAKKDSLQISIYLSGFRGIASVFPCLRLSLAGGQEK